MFKKLKQKISEEQQQLQQVLAPAQAPSGSSPPPRASSRTSSFTEQVEGTPDRENASVQATKSPSSVNGSELPAPQLGDTQSFAQKLQLRVPSVESLFRSPIAESLFRSSSKESLVRTPSRESLNRLDLDCSPAAFDPPSDMESEAEDSVGNADGLSKEQLIQRLRRMERSLSNYRGKYSELVTAYQTLQREKKKLQGILSQSQDKALRRIGELREELQMDQQAKKHLQEEFDASLEEKDQYISVLQTQVSLLKHRLQNGPMMNADLLKPLPQPELQAEGLPKEGTVPKEENSERGLEPIGGGAASEALETLQQRVRRQENLLQRCKETIQSHKEQCTLLASEKEALQEQLEERLQELEKMKELHMAEKTKLITQLRDAKNLIEQLEQDKGMVIAETKRQMHETLEMKEEEITQLRVRIKQVTAQGDELREQKEKSEKAAFEELEKALSAAQKTEEARKRLKAEMEEQLKAVEKAGQEERARLRQELDRARQEAAESTRKSAEEQIAKLRKCHEEELARREQELTEKLQAREGKFQERMKVALEKSQSEYLKITQEKEQQESLALEELELQKKAILAESENKLRDLQQEAETYRTRILELESALEKSLQEGKSQSEDLAIHLEAEKNKHNREITIMVEKHRTELETLQQQKDSLWTEKLRIVQHQHQTEMEKLREKCEQEKEALLKDKEVLFQAHVEEMNEKTLEKLDVKQTELESLSLELSEVLTARHNLEEELSALRDQADKVKQELETKLDEQESHHQKQMDRIIKEHELSAQRTEKALKDEVSQRGLLLQEKDRQLQEQRVRTSALEAELQQALAKLDLCQSSESTFQEQARAYGEQVAQLHQRSADLEAERVLLTKQIAEVETQKKDLSAELEAHQIRVRDLVQQLEKQNSEMGERVKSVTQLYESRLKDSSREQEQTKQILMEKENLILQMKEGQSKEMEILKQKLAAKEDSISILHEEYETKFKNQEKKMEKIKQKAKEMQETLKKKLLDQEAKLQKELENTVLELSQKEKQFNAKILEMAQANSAGINDVVSRLEMNQREQIASLTEVHQRKLSDVVLIWEQKLHQQAAELQERHDAQLREKEQEVAELQQKLLTFGCEKEEANREAVWLKEEGLRRDTALGELRQQLEQKSAQLETLAADRGRSLQEKALLEEQLAELKTVAEQEKRKVSELTDQLKAAADEFQSLKSSHEQSKKSLEDQSLEFKKLCEALATQLDVYCKKTEALLQVKTNELVDVSNGKINAIFSRISHCQRHTTKIKETLLIQTCKVSELEAQLRQLREEQNTLNSSFQQATHQLEEKENQIKSMRADIEGLVAEKEALQREGGHQQQAASEKESCITQLKKELSENINAVTLMKEELQEKKSEISSLNKQLADLNDQLQNSVSLTEKEAAVSSLSKRYDEEHRGLWEQVQDLSSQVDTLSKEKTSALEQADHLSVKFSEWKRKTQLRLTQNQNTIKELQVQLELKTKEASEKDEQINILQDDLGQQNKRFEGFKGEMEENKSKMEEKKCSLETELRTQTARIMELEERVSQKTAETESLHEVLKNYHQQKDTEQRELVQKLQRMEELGEEKDSRVREAEEEVSRLEKQVSSMKSELEMKKKELEHVSSSVRHTEEAFKALEERLELESAAKLAELKKKAEQKVAAIRKQLLSQMEDKEQQYRTARDSHVRELSAKLEEREKEVLVLEGKLKSVSSAPQPETPAVPGSSEQGAVGSMRETADPRGSVQEACDKKASVVQRNLTEKEKLSQRLEQEEEAASRCDMQHRQEGPVARLEHADTERLTELEEENKTCPLVESHHVGEGGGNDNTGVEPTSETGVDGAQKAVQEKELACQVAEQKVVELESCLASEREAHRADVEELAARCERLQALLRQTGVEKEPKGVLGETAEQKSKPHEAQPARLGGTEALHGDLELKLAGAEREKQRLAKEVTRLQKDLRTLRREHQQELDVVRKEWEQELEEKIKQEQEDLELKHNSTLKQLMREFNTQLAQKEQELERTVRETIDKAQEVEAELLESHQEERNQLHKKIAETEEDLKRTARRYEEILDAREEEMTAKVTELQTQLEALQRECQQWLGPEGTPGGGQVTIMELQTQLAQKTTLLSDSKLKEQEFREQIHSLEDRLKKYEKNIYATTVGTPYKGGNMYHTDVSLFGEPTEFEYLRKVLFEYMMGRETKTMAKVITSVLKFPDEQTQKILEREDARLTSWLRSSS